MVSDKENVEANVMTELFVVQEQEYIANHTTSMVSYIL